MVPAGFLDLAAGVGRVAFPRMGVEVGTSEPSSRRAGCEIIEDLGCPPHPFMARADRGPCLPLA
jgi:hypothetical protein